MPIYEYQCEACQGIFEEFTTTIDDQTIKSCPDCGKNANRIISNTSFSLKGDGWYATEYGTLKNRSSKDDLAAARTSDKEAPGKSVANEFSSAPSA